LNKRKETGRKAPAAPELEQRLTTSIQALKSELEEKGLLIQVRGEINCSDQLKVVAARLNEKSAAQGRPKSFARRATAGKAA
jgi:hypothetical protein